MSVFATIVVNNTNKAAAQELTSTDMFTTLFKKGLRKYWVSSGLFPQDYYDALIASDLVFAVETNEDVRPTATMVALGMTRAAEE